MAKSGGPEVHQGRVKGRGAFGLLALGIAALPGCAWQVRATRAAGLCAGRPVHVSEARGDRWLASCNTGTYACSAEQGSVHCEYLPICGNDGHYDARHGPFRR